MDDHVRAAAAVLAGGYLDLLDEFGEEGAAFAAQIVVAFNELVEGGDASAIVLDRGGVDELERFGIWQAIAFVAELEDFAIDVLEALDETIGRRALGDGIHDAGALGFEIEEAALGASTAGDTVLAFLGERQAQFVEVGCN